MGPRKVEMGWPDGHRRDVSALKAALDRCLAERRDARDCGREAYRGTQQQADGKVPRREWSFQRHINAE